MAVTQEVRNKVVVRKLPPGISCEEVRTAIDTVCQGKYDWFTFVPGKVSLKRIKHSRAYLNFLDVSEVLKFRSQFAGHAFVNKKGAQYRCVVEYAPYQRIPREKAKEDPREGTYENDADFIAFKQRTEGDPELLPSAEVQLDLKEQAKKMIAETAPKAKVTPLMQFLHDRHSLKPEKKTTIAVPLKKKSGKAVADLDLPPHLLNKQSTASQATSSKPPLSQQSSISGSKATVLPIPTTAQAHLTPSSKSKRAHGHSLAAQAKASDDDLPASSRASTPSSKGKQRSQDSKAVSAKPETASSPSTVRRVVPIKLDKTPRQVRQQTGPSQVPSRQSPDAAQQASASSEPQEGDKGGRKVRPGFQTWTPRRGGRGDEAEGDEAGPSGPQALTAARAAAAAALRAQDKAAGKQAQSQTDSASSPRMPSQGGWDPEPDPQPASSGWDDDSLPHMTFNSSRSRGKGRAGSSRSRASSGPIQQSSHHASADGWGLEPNMSQEGQDGWGDPVLPDTSAPAGRQSDARGRGRGRGRARGGRGGYLDHSTAADSTPVPPPGKFLQSTAQLAASAAPPRTVIIKKRPPPANLASE